MNDTKQSGFSIVIGIIAVVLIVGVLGLIGWRLYSQPNKKVTNSTTAPTNTPVSKESTNATTAATVTPQGTYLDIKELGIKVTLDNSISDAVYTLLPNYSTNGTKVVGISAQSLIDNETNYNSDCVAADAPLGTIAETTTQPATIKGPVAVDNKGVFKINNTYYLYSFPQGTDRCGVTPSGTQDSIVANKMNAFKQAFTTAQSDQ